MDTPFNLQQEAEYVLGMTDLYEKDSDIAAMLRMKGLNNEQTNAVLAYIRAETYQKRIRQAKKHMIIGAIVAVISAPIWYYVFSSDVYNPSAEYMDRKAGRYVVGIVTFTLIFGISQFGYGLYRYITYSAKLKKHKTYI
jgi:hypothetical protein